MLRPRDWLNLSRIFEPFAPRSLGASGSRLRPRTSPAAVDAAGQLVVHWDGGVSTGLSCRVGFRATALKKRI